ncbi:hypothetical protein D3C87_1056490 [compost metagenome]
MLASLFEYEQAKKAALVAREKHTARIDVCNSIIEKLESSFPNLVDDLNRLELAIRNATTGAPDTEGRDWTPGMNVNKLGTERLNAAHWLQVKKFFKTLARMFHPDAGGDAGEFSAIEQARRHGDLDYLRVKFVTAHRQGDLYWRQEEGIEFWRTQQKKAEVNLTRLQGTSVFKVVQAQMVGNRPEALRLMELELLKRRLELIGELNHVLKPKPSRGENDGEERERRAEEEKEEVDWRQD